VALARIPRARRRLALLAVAPCSGAARAAGEGVARGAAGGLDPRGAAAPHRVPHGRAGRAARARVAVPGAAPYPRDRPRAAARDASSRRVQHRSGACSACALARAAGGCGRAAAPAAHPSLQSRACAAWLAPPRASERGRGSAPLHARAPSVERGTHAASSQARTWLALESNPDPKLCRRRSRRAWPCSGRWRRWRAAWSCWSRTCRARAPPARTTRTPPGRWCAALVPSPFCWM